MIEKKYMKKNMFIFSLIIILECQDNVHVSIEFLENILKNDENISKIFKFEVFCLVGLYLII